jgi:hypothetical protein
MESNNPYAPPKAVVDDVSSGNAPPRPLPVTNAVKLLWAAAAVSVVSGMLNFYLMDTPTIPRSLMVALTFAYVIGFLIVWWILSSIGKGKNWARIVELVFFIIGLLGVGMSAIGPQEVPGVVWVLYAIQMGMTLWAIIQLYSAPANRWFQEMKAWV